MVPVALAPIHNMLGRLWGRACRMVTVYPISGQSAPPRSTSGPHALRPAACGVHQFAGHPWDPCWCTCCGASLLAPSGEERTLDTFAQVERAGRCCRRFDSGTHAWCGHATVMVLVSSASGPRVSGCTFYPRSAVKYFNPISVKPYPAPWVRASCVTVFLVSRCAGSLLVSNTLMTA